MIKNILAIAIFCALSACRQQPDLEAETQKLLALHAEQRAAHFNKDATLFARQFAENSLSVNRGRINEMAPDAIQQRFQGYFNSVRFEKWDDLQPPKIFFSDDARMAYVVVDKMVVLARENEKGVAEKATTHFAWVSIFKKQADGAWKIVCNVSTNEPETVVAK